MKLQRQKKALSNLCCNRNKKEVSLKKFTSFSLRSIICWFVLVLLFTCNPKKAKYSSTKKKDPRFVSINEGKFVVGSSPFFSMMLNYVVEFRRVEGQLSLGACKGYETPEQYETFTVKEVERQNKAHLWLIKSMGFNTVRICLDRVYRNDDGFYFYGDGVNGASLSVDSSQIISALSRYISQVDSAGLRVMLLLKPPRGEDELEEFTISVLKKFSNTPAVFAYDFMNEPLYFDRSEEDGEHENRSKEEVIELTTHWRAMMDEYAPNQLFTIGLSEPIEVFSWDVSMIPVDFVAFHTYHPLRIFNEMYWYANYSKVPWMIGETALPAEDDSITYADQKIFFTEVLSQVKGCRGTGLGWWDFQGLKGAGFEGTYAGLLDLEGVTYSIDSIPIIGTCKPVVEAIKNAALDTVSVPAKNCNIPVNYYNMLGYQNFLLTGKVVDASTGKPIEGAVIRGWNEYWSVGANTYTDSAGKFHLYTNDVQVHFQVSAPHYSMKKINEKIIYMTQAGDRYKGQPLNQQTLEYQQISYHPFLKPLSVGKSVFDFDKEKFTRYSFESELPTIELKYLD